MMVSPLHENNKKCLPERVFLLVVAVLLISTLCSPAAAARDVKVGLTDLKPSLYTDDQGKPVGFFVDIIEDIAAKEGWNVIWVRGSLSESWGRLSSGGIDLLPGVAATPEREKLYNFTREPALSVWSQVYARPGSGINTILDLDNRHIALVKGDINGAAFREYARKFSINATYIEKETPIELFSATAAGEADALVVFNTAGLEDARTYGLSETTVMFNPTPLGFAVRKGENQDIVAVIDHYITEGKGNPSSTYSTAMQKWFGIKTNPVIPPWLIWGFAVIGGLAILFVVMSVILRQEVRRKTAELTRQNAELQSEIVNRKRAEKELADEMSRHEVLIDQSRDGIVILDQDGAVYETNGRFAEMLGYSREEMMQLHVWDWDARFSREQLHEMIRNVDATGDHFESFLRRKDGAFIDVEISSNAEVFADRKLIFCVVRDTSERKKAEDQLKRSNEDLQSEIGNRVRAESALVQKNEELCAAYEQLTAAEENMRQSYGELQRTEQALLQARKKLNLLNTLTFQDIRNGIFSLAGFIQLAKGAGCSPVAESRLIKGEEIMRSVGTSLDFANKYQNLGINQPLWQNVNLVIVTAISHLDFSRISRTVDLDELEIFADPLLEDVFFSIMENVLTHGAGATEVRIHYRQDADSVTILVGDNGPGIKVEEKETIFGWENRRQGSISLFLAREILSITGISIRETGMPGKGARFEITVPEGGYRFGSTDDNGSRSSGGNNPS